ncbi:MAG: hypothetical protein KBA87_04640 [Lachnospiraceae bacterium]|jgi:hypothetical protein|nr:hypothetical protein [Lachnospiraceae bacterium]
MNPMDMMKIAGRMQKFNEDHPKMKAFIAAVKGDFREETVIEISVTNPEGQNRSANIKLNADDVETLNMYMNIGH